MHHPFTDSEMAVQGGSEPPKGKANYTGSPQPTFHFGNSSFPTPYLDHFFLNKPTTKAVLVLMEKVPSSLFEPLSHI